MVNLWREVKLDPKVPRVVDVVGEIPNPTRINMSTTKKMRFSEKFGVE
ncbi:MAG: hypothetical protein ACE5OT_01790 [Candidatus Hadarchaeaceae archaeon]